MKLIPLTQGKFAKVDDGDYDELMEFKWHFAKVGYAARGIWQNKRRKIIYMHRSIVRAGAGQKVDHVNGEKLDNRRSNIRLATQQQNSFNRGASRKSTSGLKGVCWHPPTGKWRAYLMLNYKHIHLGLFDDKNEALMARMSAAKKHHGEFFHA